MDQLSNPPVFVPIDKTWIWYVKYNVLRVAKLLRFRSIITKLIVTELGQKMYLLQNSGYKHAEGCWYYSGARVIFADSYIISSVCYAK